MPVGRLYLLTKKRKQKEKSNNLACRTGLSRVQKNMGRMGTVQAGKETDTYANDGSETIKCIASTGAAGSNHDVRTEYEEWLDRNIRG